MQTITAAPEQIAADKAVIKRLELAHLRMSRLEAEIDRLQKKLGITKHAGWPVGGVAVACSGL